MAQRGPEKRLTRELLIEAGTRAVEARFGSVRELDDVLGVRLREITEAAREVYEDRYGQPPVKPISSTAIYREWRDRQSFLRDVFAAMFTPPGAQVAEALNPEADDYRSWQEVLGDWVDADHDNAAEAGPTFLLAFIPAANGDATAAEALATVYRGYDAVVVPALRVFLRRHGLVVNLPADSADEDGVGRLAQMLTVITEGWFLRAIAQPGACRSSAGGRTPWAQQAIALVSALTRRTEAGAA